MLHPSPQCQPYEEKRVSYRLISFAEGDIVGAVATLVNGAFIAVSERPFSRPRGRDVRRGAMSSFAMRRLSEAGRGTLCGVECWGIPRLDPQRSHNTRVATSAWGQKHEYRPRPRFASLYSSNGHIGAAQQPDAARIKLRIGKLAMHGAQRGRVPGLIGPLSP
jgi:hypothetical protein